MTNCLNCNSDSAEESYSFIVAEITDQQSYEGYSISGVSVEKTITCHTNYRSVGEESAAICRNCIRKYMHRNIVPFVLLSMLISIFPAIQYLLSKNILEYFDLLFHPAVTFVLMIIGIMAPLFSGYFLVIFITMFFYPIGPIIAKKSIIKKGLYKHVKDVNSIKPLMLFRPKEWSNLVKHGERKKKTDEVDQIDVVDHCGAVVFGFIFFLSGIIMHQHAAGLRQNKISTQETYITNSLQGGSGRKVNNAVELPENAIKETQEEIVTAKTIDTEIMNQMRASAEFETNPNAFIERVSEARKSFPEKKLIPIVDQVALDPNDNRKFKINSGIYLVQRIKKKHAQYVYQIITKENINHNVPDWIKNTLDPIFNKTKLEDAYILMVTRNNIGNIEDTLYGFQDVIAKNMSIASHNISLLIIGKFPIFQFRKELKENGQYDYDTESYISANLRNELPQDSNEPNLKIVRTFGEGKITHISTNSITIEDVGEFKNIYVDPKLVKGQVVQDGQFIGIMREDLQLKKVDQFIFIPAIAFSKLQD